MIDKDRGYKKKIMIFSKASKKHQHSPRLDSALLSQCYRGLKEKGKGNNLGKVDSLADLFAHPTIIYCSRKGTADHDRCGSALTKHTLVGKEDH